MKVTFRSPTNGELVALAGAALLLLALWQPWFVVELDAFGVSMSVRGNAWEVFGLFDWLFAGLAVIGIAIVVGELTGARVIAGDAGRGLLALGGTVIASAAIRWWDRPGPSRSVQLPDGISIGADRGLYMAALAGGLIALGGWLVANRPAPSAEPDQPFAPDPWAAQQWQPDGGGAPPAPVGSAGQAPVPWHTGDI